jgi:hypothetical protein
MTRRTSFLLAPFVLLMACTQDTAQPLAPLQATPPVQLSKTAKGGRAASPGVVYVSGQGLYYDTFVSASSLPMHGRFQKLEPQADGSPSVTEFGPGDPGYLGGRWWVDANGDGIQNDGDAFLLCPLLPPGRTSP